VDIFTVKYSDLLDKLVVDMLGELIGKIRRYVFQKIVFRLIFELVTFLQIF